MLVLDGNPAYSGRSPVSRRSVVALDRSGHVLLLATPLLGISLEDLAAWLAASDLDIVNALNLDGGGSTMFYARSGNAHPVAGRGASVTGRLARVATTAPQTAADSSASSCRATTARS